MFPINHKDKKMKHYGPKKTGKPEMSGIVAKQAIKPNIARKLGIHIINKEDEKSNIALCSTIFMEILRLKYNLNEQSQNELINTGNEILVEFDRGAYRESTKNRTPLWTGLVKDGIVYGFNLQGKLQMSIRNEFASL